MTEHLLPFKLLIFDWEGTLAIPSIAPTALFPNTLQVLKTLHEQGYLLAIATSKSKAGLAADLQQTGLRPYIATAMTAEESAPKPNPTMLFNILDKLAIAVQDALMIGDTVYDLGMAQQAKMDSLAVSYGLQTREVLLSYHPRACIDKITQLPLWLLQLEKNHG